MFYKLQIAQHFKFQADDYIKNNFNELTARTLFMISIFLQIKHRAQTAELQSVVLWDKASPKNEAAQCGSDASPC